MIYFFWLLGGKQKVKKFLSSVWGKKYLILRRNQKNFYKKKFNLLSIDQILSLVDKKSLKFGIHLTTQKVINSIGYNTIPNCFMATEFIIRKLYETGSTIQFHQPQQYFPCFASIIADLETSFGFLVGSNIYLTPPQTQGLSPHSDEIEIFVLQIEGSKEWFLHDLSINKKLPFKDSRDIKKLNFLPVTKITNMISGDLLYFPRGCIHYARTNNLSSIHITFSTFQAASIGTFMEFLIKHLINLSIKKDQIFRNHIPLCYLFKTGNLFKVKNFKIRAQFIRILSKHILLLGNYLERAIDETADEFGIEFVSKRLTAQNLEKFSTNIVSYLKFSTLIRCISPSLFRVIDERKENIFRPIINECFKINSLEKNIQLKKNEVKDYFLIFDSLHNQTIRHMFMYENENEFSPLKPSIHFHPLIKILIYFYPKSIKYETLLKISSIKVKVNEIEEFFYTLEERCIIIFNHK